MNPECEDPKAPDDLRDVDGYFPIEVPDWLWWLLGIVILSALGYWIYIRFIKKLPPIELTKYQKVVRDLAALDTNQNSKDYYLALSEISRGYFEEELKVFALDRTVDELMPALRAHELVHTSQSLLIKDILERADLAKFAKAEVNSEEKKRDQSAIISVITEINTAKEIKAAAERAKIEALTAKEDEE
jgi:hypothetical protein